VAPVVLHEDTEPRVPSGQVEVITSNALRSPTWPGWPSRNICVSNDHRYVPFVVIIIRYFLHSRLITRYVIRRVPQELLSFPEKLSWFPVFSGVRVARSLVFCVMFWATLYQKRQVLEYWLGDKWYTLFSNRPRLLHVNTICLYIHIYSILWNILKVDFTMVGNGYSSLEQYVLWVQPCLVFVIRFIYILWMYIDSSDVCVWGSSKNIFNLHNQNRRDYF
jgi:hypothetical protein